MTAAVATDSVAVLSGNWLSFEGTDQRRLANSPWWNGSILQLSVENSPEATVRLAFIVQDLSNEKQPFVCKRGAASHDHFETLGINLKDREVYANGNLTFTFDECGIDPGKKNMNRAGPDADIRRWNFDVFVIPMTTSGRLEGTYEYRLKADLI